VLDGKEVERGMGGGPVFSPDSKRLACRARAEGGNQCLSVDRKRGQAFARIGRGTIVFSPDSKRVAFAVFQMSGARFVVVDDSPGSKYADIRWGISPFSPDSRHFAYIARKDTKEFVVIDGREGKKYDAVFVGKEASLFTGPDRIRYFALAGQRVLSVTEQLGRNRNPAK